MPGTTAFFSWIQEDVEFAKRYARATQVRAELYADRILDEAYKAEPETVNVQRLKVDSLKWIACKLFPSKYGEKQGDVHVNSTVNNFVVLTADRLKQLQERHREALQ